MARAEEAGRWYAKRFRIETFFSDQKSRGFHIHTSPMSDVQRLSRLLIAACLAYIWIVYLGAVCETGGWRPVIHRRKRCDLRLFQLGLRFLDHLLNEEMPIPVEFHVTIEQKKVYGSEFQLGLRMLEHLLNEDLPIPVAFHLAI